MKTAISIPDKLFNDAERLARRKKLTRSAFYALAISEYLQRQQGQAITAAYNAVYAPGETLLEPPLRAARARVLKDNPW